FGFAPDIITTGWPGFANQGDEVLLILPDSRVADGLVYGSGSVTQSWWQGAAVQPFRAGGLVAAEGQILYRRSDLRTKQRAADTDSRCQGPQKPDDVLCGRQLRYPG